MLVILVLCQLGAPQLPFYLHLLTVSHDLQLYLSTGGFAQKIIISIKL